MLTQDEVLSIYVREGAVWFYNYSGDLKAPHAKLTSGLCSDGFVSSPPVLCQPQLAEILAKELKDKIQSRVGTVDWVVGSPYAAITFSYELARQLGARHGFPEKDPKNSGQLIWNPSRFPIPAGAFVLQCEELITTLGTTEKVRDAIVFGNPNPVSFLSLVAAGVYRPASFEGASREVVALIEREVKSWQSEECPLCTRGSKPLRPREGQNWAKLTGKGW